MHRSSGLGLEVVLAVTRVHQAIGIDGQYRAFGDLGRKSLNVGLLPKLIPGDWRHAIYRADGQVPAAYRAHTIRALWPAFTTGPTPGDWRHQWIWRSARAIDAAGHPASSPVDMILGASVHPDQHDAWR
jgi:hypothetical protein